MSEQPGDGHSLANDNESESQGWILVGLANGKFQRYRFNDTKLKVLIVQLDADEPYEPPEPQDYLFKARVACQSITVRDAPSMQGNAVHYVYQDDHLLVTDVHGWFWKHDRGGWSHSWWLRRIPLPGQTVYRS